MNDGRSLGHRVGTRTVDVAQQVAVAAASVHHALFDRYSACFDNRHSPSVNGALATDQPRTVLDVGRGPGDIARHLAPLVERIDAVDASAGMLAAGAAAPGGDAPNLRWIHGRIEEVQLEPPYALISAGESLHWFDWELVMPRFADMLWPNGVLAIVNRDWDGPPAIHQKLLPVLKQFGAVRVWQNVDLLDELTRRGLFEVRGERRFAPEAWEPTVDEYILARHSQRSFSRTHMGPAAAAAFDAALRGVLAEVPTVEGRLQLNTTAHVCWGRPRR
jgi:SAM-dependent methyltransferase